MTSERSCASPQPDIADCIAKNIHIITLAVEIALKGRDMKIGKYVRLFLMSLLLCITTATAHAGADISGPVERVQLAPDGKLWFSMDTTPATTYCKAGWYRLTMYVPKEDPNFAYYFAIIMTAVSKGKSIYIANISAFDGTTACDITKTGYGIVLLQGSAF